jgi:hypothetical protein
MNLSSKTTQADRGYDAFWLRKEILQRGSLPLIPIGDVKDAPSLREVCKNFNCIKMRWKVEKAIEWLKRKYRRLMMRWGRHLRISVYPLLVEFLSGIGSTT